MLITRFKASTADRLPCIAFASENLGYALMNHQRHADPLISLPSLYLRPRASAEGEGEKAARMQSQIKCQRVGQAGLQRTTPVRALVVTVRAEKNARSIKQIAEQTFRWVMYMSEKVTLEFFGSAACLKLQFRNLQQASHRIEKLRSTGEGITLDAPQKCCGWVLAAASLPADVA